MATDIGSHTLPPMGKYIAVAGNMGAGKTSLVEFLTRRFQLQPIYEPNDDNPYLGLFYEDMSRWAFASQIHFLIHKFRLHRQMEAFERVAVQDRTIYEDAEIFAYNLMEMGYLSDTEYGTYRDLYESVLPFVRPPDLMIYLKCPVRAIRRRIKKRGRPEEQTVPAAYLRRLNRLYEAWYDRYDLSPKVQLDTSKLDYVTDLVDRLDLLAHIEEYL